MVNNAQGANYSSIHADPNYFTGNNNNNNETNINTNTTSTTTTINAHNMFGTLGLS